VLVWGRSLRRGEDKRQEGFVRMELFNVHKKAFLNPLDFQWILHYTLEMWEEIG
jgi:hypothetical protein